MGDSNKRIFYVNSQNRIAGTSSDFHYTLDMKGIDPTHAVVMSAYIPKSYYTFQSGYNTFIFTENGVDNTVTIPPGSYNRNNLARVLAGLLNDISQFTYTITYPASTVGDTGKYTYAATGFGVDNETGQTEYPDVSFTFTESCYEQLGFEPNSTVTFTINPDESYTLESVNVINLQTESTVYIKSDIIQDHDNILQEIYGGNSLSYSGISFTQSNVDHYSKPLLNKESNSFRFYITNENGQPLDLNGLNCVFSIMVYRPINQRALANSLLERLTQ